jgi:V/A-type H+-transporting ATPase subunit E
MGLDNIRQSVLADAKAKATRIVDSAENTAANLVKSRKEAAEQEFDRICRHRMQAIEEEYSRKLIQIKGVAGKQVLDKKNDLLRSLFEKARGEILAWPAEKYAGVMRRLIEKSAGDDEGEVRVHPDETAVFEKILSELNAGRHAKLSLSRGAPLPKRGGFIFVSADFEVDQTLDTILREIEYDTLPVIAESLFRQQ